MTTSTFLITAFLKKYENSLSDPNIIEQIKKDLFNNGICTKDYPDEQLLLIYNKYDDSIMTPLKRECRSLVIDYTNLQIKSYSCETPRLNKEGLEFLLSHTDSPQRINICYEGTYLSIFNHNDKWYVSTRRCLDSNDSIFTNNKIKGDNATDIETIDKSHYNMLEEVLQNAGYNNFAHFCENLDKTKSYYFVLIHHQNKHLIDYTEQFGEKYARICLTTIRDSNMNEIDIYTNTVNSSTNISYANVHFATYDETGHIFIPTKLESIDEFANFNKLVSYDSVPKTEGIVIHIWSSTLNKYNLIKLQHINYQFARVIGTDHNLFKGMLYLYQLNKLSVYFTQNINMQNIRQIANPINPSEVYDTIGIIDAVFKTCTSELLELFKILWHIKTGKHKHSNLYNLLPKEYKDIMFGIKGIYLENKANKSNNGVYLKINDIYNYLKNISTDQFIAFIRMRKLMFNWVKYEVSDKKHHTTMEVDNTLIEALKDFATISNFCDKVHLKLCAIFTSKLFPSITPTDIPPQLSNTQDNVVDKV